MTLRDNQSVLTQDRIFIAGSAIVGAVLGLMAVFVVRLLFIPWNSTVQDSRATGSVAAVSKSEAPFDLKGMEGVDKKLRDIGVAFLNFESAFKRLAPVKDSKLSWRVHLLPFLDQKPLYDRFHMDEPWDSPHNITLLEYMPDVYQLGGGDRSTTPFQVITGEGMIFSGDRPGRIADVTDGMSHTILALVTGPDKRVVWTKPDELTISQEDPARSLGAITGGMVLCVSCTSTPLAISVTKEPQNFYALCTPHGSEIIDSGKYNLSKLLAPRPSVIAGVNVQPVIDARIRSERATKLNRLGHAMINYESAFKRFPLTQNPANFDTDGKPKLSWRVHILPFIEMQPLYSKFKLDEPWDSPNNLPLADFMPDLFRDPTDSSDSNQTRYLTFTGPNTPFDKPAGPRLSEFSDGISNTILLALAGSDKAVMWTKPQDLTLDPESAIASLGRLESEAITFVTADGAVQRILPNTPSDVFRALVTPAGREVLPLMFNDFKIQ